MTRTIYKTIWFLLFFSVVFSLTDTLTLSDTLATLTTGQNGSVEATSYNSDGSMLLTAALRTITLWNRSAGGNFQRGQIITVPDGIGCASFDNSGLKIAAGTGGSFTYVYRLNPTSKQYELWQRINYQSDSPSQRIRTLSFSQDDSKLVTGSTDKSVNIWELEKQSDTYVFKQKLTAHSDEIVSVSAQKDKIMSAGAFNDRSIKIWQIQPSNLYKQVQSISVGNRSNDVQLSHDESIVVAGLRNGSILIWSFSDVDKNYVPYQTITDAHPNGLYRVELSRDGSRLASISADNTTALWARQTNGQYNLSQRIQQVGNSLAMFKTKELAVGLPLSVNGQTKIYSIDLNCASIGNSIGKGKQAGTCQCQVGYQWNAGSCQPNCTQINKAVGPAENGGCTCESGYYWSNVGCIRNCTLVQNSDKILRSTGLCVCLPGFTWSGAQCVQQVVQTTTTVTSVTSQTTPVVPPVIQTTQLQAGSPSPAAPSSVVIGATPNPRAASNNIVPAPMNRPLVMSATNSSVDPTSLTVDCVTIPNGTGRSIDSRCQCKQGYVWSGRSCSRDCRSVANSFGYGDGLNTCICKFDYTWDARLEDCVPNSQATQQGVPSARCRNIAYSTGRSADQETTCICQPGFIWGSNFCIRDCKSDPGSTGDNIGIDICICKDGFNWNQSTCVNPNAPPPQIVTPPPTVPSTVNPPLIINPTPIIPRPTTTVVTSQPTTTTVIQPPIGTSTVVSTTTTTQPVTIPTPTITAIQIDCNKIPFAVGQNGPSACTCTDKYSWNGFSCVVNCTNFQYSTGQSNGVNSCVCAKNYIWRNQQCQLEAQIINCMMLPNSVGYDGKNPQVCVCNQGYIFNGTNCIARTSTIFVPTVNCSAINNSIGVDPVNPSQCLCTANYNWEKGGCNINCTRFGLMGRLDSNTCACPTGQSFINFICTILCSNISKATRNVNTTACECVQNYRWEGGRCQIDCQRVGNNDGYNSNTGTCNCIKPFSFSNDQCQLNCSMVDNSNGQNSQKRGVQCNCNNGYEWNAARRACDKKSSNKLGVGLGIGLGVGIPVLLGLVGLSVWACYKCCQPPAPIPVPPIIPPMFSQGHLSTKPNIMTPPATAGTIPPQVMIPQGMIPPQYSHNPFQGVQPVPQVIEPVGVNSMIRQGVTDSYRSPSFRDPMATSSTIQERVVGTGSFIQERPGGLVSSRYLKQTGRQMQPYGTNSVMGGMNSGIAYNYQGVPMVSPRELPSSMMQQSESYVRPSYGFLSTQSGAQSRIRNNPQVSDDFIKNF